MKTYGRKRSRPNGRRNDEPLLLSPPLLSKRAPSSSTSAPSSLSRGSGGAGSGGFRCSTRLASEAERPNATKTLNIIGTKEVTPARTSSSSSLLGKTPTQSKLSFTPTSTRTRSTNRTAAKSIKTASTAKQRHTSAGERTREQERARRRAILASVPACSLGVSDSPVGALGVERRESAGGLFATGLGARPWDDGNSVRGSRRSRQSASMTDKRKRRPAALTADGRGGVAKEQMCLDFGQRSLGKRILCQRCDMLYVCGSEEDEVRHTAICARVARGVEFAGWRQERVKVRFPDDGGRIIEIREGDPAPHRAKLHEVERLMDVDMGFAPGARRGDAKASVDAGEEKRRSASGRSESNKANHTFLYVREKRVLGCVVAERIESARRVVPEAGRLAEEEARRLGASALGGFLGLEGEENENKPGEGVDCEEEAESKTNASLSFGEASDTAFGGTEERRGRNEENIHLTQDEIQHGPSHELGCAVNSTVTARRIEDRRTCDNGTLGDESAAMNAASRGGHTVGNAGSEVLLTDKGESVLAGAVSGRENGEMHFVGDSRTGVGVAQINSRNTPLLSDVNCDDCFQAPELRTWTAGVGDSENESSMDNVDRHVSNTRRVSALSEGANDEAATLRDGATDVAVRDASAQWTDGPHRAIDPSSARRRPQELTESQHDNQALTHDNANTLAAVRGATKKGVGSGQRHNRPGKTQNGGKVGSNAKQQKGGIWGYFGSSTTVAMGGRGVVAQEGGTEEEKGSCDAAAEIGQKGDFILPNDARDSLTTMLSAANMETEDRGEEGKVQAREGVRTSGNFKGVSDFSKPSNGHVVQKQKNGGSEDEPLGKDVRKTGNKQEQLAALDAMDTDNAGGGGCGGGGSRKTKRVAAAAANDDPLQHKLDRYFSATSCSPPAKSVTPVVETATPSSALSTEATASPSPDGDSVASMSGGTVHVRQPQKPGTRDEGVPLPGAIAVGTSCHESESVHGIASTIGGDTDVGAGCDWASSSIVAKPESFGGVFSKKDRVEDEQKHQSMLHAGRVACNLIEHGTESAIQATLDAADRCDMSGGHRNQEVGKVSSEICNTKSRCGKQSGAERNPPIREAGNGRRGGDSSVWLRNNGDGTDGGNGSGLESRGQRSGSKRERTFSMDSSSSSMVNSPSDNQRKLVEEGRVKEEDLLPLPCSGLIVSDEETPAVVGILQMWVHGQSRRQGVATRLIDTVREKMVYGCPLRLDQIAFSQPTREGQAFATRYTEDTLLVY